MNLHHFTTAELTQWLQGAKILRRTLEAGGQWIDLDHLDANITAAKAELRRRVEAAPLVRIGQGEYVREYGAGGAA